MLNQQTLQKMTDAFYDLALGKDMSYGVIGATLIMTFLIILLSRKIKRRNRALFVATALACLGIWGVAIL